MNKKNSYIEKYDKKLLKKCMNDGILINNKNIKRELIEYECMMTTCICDKQIPYQNKNGEYCPCSFCHNRFKKLKFLYSDSHIPINYLYKGFKDIKITEKNKEIVKKIKEWVLNFKNNNTKGLYFWSSYNHELKITGNGNGKTFFLCIILNNLIWFEIKCRYVNIIEMLNLMRKNWQDKSNNENIDIDKLKKYEILVMDELPVIFNEKENWKYEILYNIINYRYNKNLITLYGSNLSLPDIGKSIDYYGPAIFSRINEMCEIVHFTDADFRRIIRKI